MKIPLVVEKFFHLFEHHPPVGGLEISDAALRFAFWANGDLTASASVRLPPGTISGGELVNPEAFAEVLQALRLQLGNGFQKKRRASVIVSLDSPHMYTQVFRLPLVGGESLEKAIELNIQMVSPIEFSEVYSGWELVYTDEEKGELEISSAFIAKRIVDPLRTALEAAGFLAVVLESKAHSLTRLVRHAAEGFDANTSHLLIDVDAGGMDFLILRHGELYFDYFTSWRDIGTPGGEITPEDFSSALIKNVNQVLNFYHSHWNDPIANILLSAAGMHDEAKSLLERYFAFPVQDLEIRALSSAPASPSNDWFVVLGAAFRGSMLRREDKELSLLGISPQEEFRQGELLETTRFWRTLTPSLLAFLLLAMIGADVALTRIRNSLEGESLFNLPQEQLQGIEAIETRAKEFNRLVSLLAAVDTETLPKASIIERIVAVAAASEVSIDRLSLLSPSTPITLSGQTKSEDYILNFKKALEADGNFMNVNVALPNIKPGAQGVTFSVSFSLKPSKTP